METDFGGTAKTPILYCLWSPKMRGLGKLRDGLNQKLF
jgi:hypothetical protein